MKKILSLVLTVWSDYAVTKAKTEILNIRFEVVRLR